MMRIELVKRPQHSALFSALSPFIALGFTLVAGAIMFSVLGKNPLDALYYYFVDPLTGIWDPGNRWQLHELAIKAAPPVEVTSADPEAMPLVAPDAQNDQKKADKAKTDNKVETADKKPADTGENKAAEAPVAAAETEQPKQKPFWKLW